MTNPIKSADFARITAGARGEYDKAGRALKGWARHVMYSPRSVQDRPYSGNNIALLRQAAKDNGYLSSYWGTWRAWMCAGCRPQGKPAGRVWNGNIYYHLWNYEQVRVENMPLFELEAPAVASEVVEQYQDQAREQGRLTRADRQGYRWNCIRNKD